MLDHVFHANIFAYCRQNQFIRLAIFSGLFRVLIQIACKILVKSKVIQKRETNPQLKGNGLTECVALSGHIHIILH